MFKIVKKKKLNKFVVQMEILAPLVVKKALPGQFIILRVDDNGERIPLTIAGINKELGTVKIIFQIVGATTFKLNQKNEGDFILDFVGPLGLPTDISEVKNICIVGGGVGCAIALPVAKAFHDSGSKVTTVIGFRNKELVILEDEFKNISDSLVVMTDDGSYGKSGNVTIALNEMLNYGIRFDKIITIGPSIMMKYVVQTAKPYEIPVIVSMNSLMIDGTGMCGCCRLSVWENDKYVTKFACIDGPDFDGYKINFDEVISRNSIYRDYEKHVYDKTCNLFRKIDND